MMEMVIVLMVLLVGDGDGWLRLGSRMGITGVEASNAYKSQTNFFEADCTVVGFNNVLLSNDELWTKWCEAMRNPVLTYGETDCKKISNAFMNVRIYERPGTSGNDLQCVLDNKDVSCKISENLDSSVYEFTTYVLDSSKRFTSRISINQCDPDAQTYYVATRIEWIEDNSDDSLEKITGVTGASVFFSIVSFFMLTFIYIRK